MSAPKKYISWINRHLGFNPRSQAASNALSDFVIEDLRKACKPVNKNFRNKRLAVAKNPTVRTRVAGRSVDLVFYEGTGRPNLSVRVSVEHKSIMTAHGKARWNRYGDVVAYSNHMHNHRKDCIAASIVVVNISAAYENPDAFAKGLKRPRLDMKKVVADTVCIFANIPLRNEPEEANDQPEALAVIVVDYDGVNQARLVTGGSAPRPKSKIHYSRFIRRLCSLYRKRFSAE